MMQKRLYQKKKQRVEKFIKRFGKVEHSFILNEVNIDYDTLMKILEELRKEGHIK
jgi:predicted transcriptional regulator